METEKEVGMRIMRELLGDEYMDAAIEKMAAGVFGIYPAEHSVEACFGTIWARPELDMRSRSIATISMLIAINEPVGLKNHIRGGLRLGIKHTEIAELAYQAIPYVGYPIAGSALRAMLEVFTEEGLL